MFRRIHSIFRLPVGFLQDVPASKVTVACINGNSRIQYMEVCKRTICLAIFGWDIPLGLKHRPDIWR